MKECASGVQAWDWCADHETDARHQDTSRLRCQNRGHISGSVIKEYSNKYSGYQFSLLKQVNLQTGQLNLTVPTNALSINKNDKTMQQKTTDFNYIRTKTGVNGFFFCFYHMQQLHLVWQSLTGDTLDTLVQVEITEIHILQCDLYNIPAYAIWC